MYTQVYKNEYKLFTIISIRVCINNLKRFRFIIENKLTFNLIIKIAEKNVVPTQLLYSTDQYVKSKTKM